MPNIEQEMLQAVRERRGLKRPNTEVTYDPTTEVGSVQLFGNEIAQTRDRNTALFLSDGGRRSATTRSRLNALGTLVPRNPPSVQTHGGNWVWKNEDGTRDPFVPRAWLLNTTPHAVVRALRINGIPEDLMRRIMGSLYAYRDFERD